MKRGSTAITLTALVLVLSAASSSAWAGNAIVGTGQEHTVTERNERLDGVFAGIRVAVDKAHVNLTNATVDCSLGNTNHGVGIHLYDTHRVHINGGTVKNCNVGVLLGGKFSADPKGGSGNHINNVVVRDSGGLFGTWFDGDGIVVNNGTNNRINNNEVVNVGGSLVSAGIRLFQGAGNDLAGNSVDGLKPSVPAGNPTVGILLQGADESNVHGNTAFARPDQGYGIWVHPDTLDNVITGNKALGNGIDLVDGNADCGNNVWEDNTFVSSNAACIQ